MTVEQREFVKCKLSGCGFGFRHADDFSQRSLARGILLRDCVIRKCLVGPVILEDVCLQNLDTDVTIIWGALFKHVTIKGRVDKMMIHGIPRSVLVSDRAAMAAYWKICDTYYVNVDWALDIREAEFEDFSIRTRGIPAQLIRRDGETQALIAAEKLKDMKWKTIGIGSLTGMSLKFWENEGGEDLLIVAPKRDKRDFAEVMADIKKLRAAGIADPN